MNLRSLAVSALTAVVMVSPFAASAQASNAPSGRLYNAPVVAGKTEAQLVKMRDETQQRIAFRTKFYSDLDGSIAKMEVMARNAEARNEPEAVAMIRDAIQTAKDSKVESLAIIEEAKGDIVVINKQIAVVHNNPSKPVVNKPVSTIAAKSTVATPKAVSAKRNTNVAVSTTLRYNGKAVANKQVNLQRLVGKTWKSVASGKTNRAGTAIVKFKAATGTYRFQFTTVKGEANGSVSNAFAVRAR